MVASALSAIFLCFPYAGPAGEELQTPPTRGGMRKSSSFSVTSVVSVISRPFDLSRFPEAGFRVVGLGRRRLWRAADRGGR